MNLKDFKGTWFFFESENKRVEPWIPVNRKAMDPSLETTSGTGINDHSLHGTAAPGFGGYRVRTPRTEKDG